MAKFYRFIFTSTHPVDRGAVSRGELRPDDGEPLSPAVLALIARPMPQAELSVQYIEFEDDTTEQHP